MISNPSEQINNNKCEAKHKPNDNKINLNNNPNDIKITRNARISPHTFYLRLSNKYFNSFASSDFSPDKVISSPP